MPLSQIGLTDSRFNIHFGINLGLAWCGVQRPNSQLPIYLDTRELLNPWTGVSTEIPIISLQWLVNAYSGIAALQTKLNEQGLEVNSPRATTYFGRDNPIVRRSYKKHEI